MTIKPTVKQAFTTEKTETWPSSIGRTAPRTVPSADREVYCAAPASEETGAMAAFESRNLFIAALPPADRLRLRNMSSFHPLPQGLVLQEPDQVVEHVHFIESGMISLVVALQDGAEIEAATLGREAILGAMSAFGTHRTNTRAIVQVPGSAWRLSAADFRVEAEKSSALRRMALLSSELTLVHTQQTAACNAVHSAEQRLCRWIAQVRDRVDEDVDIRLTHEFLAQMLAVRRPTVSLIAYELQRAGLIRYQRGRITILDRSGLERAACECLGSLRNKTQRLTSPVG